MAEKLKLFSSSFGGYNKEEVVEYIEELNRKMTLLKEQYDFETARLENERCELEKKVDELSEKAESADKLSEENSLLKNDIENQKNAIIKAEEKISELSSKVSGYEVDYERNKIKAAKYDESILKAKNIVSEAEMCAKKILDDAKYEAESTARKVKEESDTLVNQNLKKVKFLYKRRDELLEAFSKVKNAAGGFYDEITNAMNSDEK